MKKCDSDRSFSRCLGHGRTRLARKREAQWIFGHLETEKERHLTTSDLILCGVKKLNGDKGDGRVEMMRWSFALPLFLCKGLVSTFLPGQW